jgi:hypothetical protein
VVRKPHTLKCLAVTGTETKLTCIKKAFFFNVPLDYFRLVTAVDPRYIASTRTAQKNLLPSVTLLLRVTQPLPSNGCFSGSTVLNLRKYATIYIYIYICTSIYTYVYIFVLMNHFREK